MNIKRKGTYLVYGQEFCALVKFVGEFPHLIIVSGIELVPFIQRGEVKELKKDSVELAMIAEHPDAFVYLPLHEAFGDIDMPGLRYNGNKETVEFSKEEEVAWIDYYSDCMRYGLPISKLISRMMFDGKSYGQAQLLVSMIEKKLARKRAKL